MRLSRSGARLGGTALVVVTAGACAITFPDYTAGPIAGSGTGAGGAGGATSTSRGASSSSSQSSGGGAASCQVLHDLADCGASGRCTVVDETSGALGCVASSSQLLKPFDACVGDGNCPAGTWCNPLTSVCSPFCASSQDCTPGTCIGAVDSTSTSIPGVKVCTADCSPDLVTPCGTGATCVYDPANGQFDCASSKFAGQSVPCQQSSDCGPGLVCAVNATSSGSCQYWCEPVGQASPDCLGALCNPFSGTSPIVRNGVTYGYCTN